MSVAYLKARLNSVSTSTVLDILIGISSDPKRTQDSRYRLPHGAVAAPRLPVMNSGIQRSHADKATVDHAFDNDSPVAEQSALPTIAG